MSKYDTIIEVRKFNPYHGADGRFSTESGAASFTFRPGKSKAHDASVRRAQLKQRAGGRVYQSLDKLKSEARRLYADKQKKKATVTAVENSLKAHPWMDLKQKLAANKNALDKIERDLDQVNSAIAYHEMTKPKNDEDVPLF